MTTAVVIAPSAFGIGDDLRTQMRELAAHAHDVVAIDLFGDALPYTDMAGVMARVRSLDRVRAQTMFNDAVQRARNDGATRVIALGICLGGPTALAADNVDGVVCWHGTGIERSVDHLPNVALRLHFGSNDPVVPISAVDVIRAACSTHHNARVVVHEGATHGFTHRSASAYDPVAEAAGMASVVELVI
jgi:dienelactone hydrolase